jgi:hypothetical protein
MHTACLVCFVVLKNSANANDCLAATVAGLVGLVCDFSILLCVRLAVSLSTKISSLPLPSAKLGTEDFHPVDGHQNLFVESKTTSSDSIEALLEVEKTEHSLRQVQLAILEAVQRHEPHSSDSSSRLSSPRQQNAHFNPSDTFGSKGTPQTEGTVLITKDSAQNNRTSSTSLAKISSEFDRAGSLANDSSSDLNAHLSISPPSAHRKLSPGASSAQSNYTRVDPPLSLSSAATAHDASFIDSSVLVTTNESRLHRHQKPSSVIDVSSSPVNDMTPVQPLTLTSDFHLPDEQIQSSALSTHLSHRKTSLPPKHGIALAQSVQSVSPHAL